MKLVKSVALYFSVIGYVYVGLLHFIKPDFFLKIMPPYLPYHLPLVYTSGFIEISLGLCLLFKKLRFFAGWGLILLLIAVYPANIYLAFNETPQIALGISPFVASWVRLPLQFVFIGLAYWFTKP
tara:strand:- start:53 stop:427 length:375 start_codon:yes stop_codon:yes gene_type:complete